MSAWSLLHRWRAEELATGATRALADWQLMSAAALARSLLEGAMAFAWEAAKMESIWTEMKATGPPLVGEEISFREPLDAALESAQIGSRLAGAHVERSNVVTLVDKGIRSANLDKATVKEVYGYRPGKSAHQALATCRQRCWTYDWVIDLDVQKFFDEVPWDLVIRAVETVTDARWGLLYVKRWLAAPLEHPGGAHEQQSKGTPQGSAVSPILANLFKHYAFDSWMARNFPSCPFERYADDAVVHCTSRRQAELVLRRIAARMNEIGLRLHPDRTRVVYCKDGRRRAEHEHTSFTFLGYAFRARGAHSKGRNFTGFLPAISPEALRARGARLRELRIHRRTDLSLDGLARWLNPIIAGWIRYYGRFYRTAFDPLLKRVNTYPRRWAGRKYKRLRTHKRFSRWWAGLLQRQPSLFAPWSAVRSYG
jgi:RNA-directed DNA polymerase